MAEIPPELMAQLVQAMQRDDGMGALEQELGAFDKMGPDGFRQMTGLGTLDQRGQLARQGAMDQAQALEQQLAMAQSLGTPKNKNYGTVGGNIAGGIGDALGAFFGGMQAKKLGQQQGDLLAKGNAAQAGIMDQQDAGRLAAGNGRYEALRDFLAKRQAQQQQGQAQATAARPGARPGSSGGGLRAPTPPAAQSAASDASLLEPLSQAPSMVGPAFDGGMSFAPPSLTTEQLLAPYGGIPSFPNTPGGVGGQPSLISPRVTDAQRASLASVFRPMANPQPQRGSGAAARAIELASGSAADPYALFGG
jgi:hypothetical protein